MRNAMGRTALRFSAWLGLACALSCSYTPQDESTASTAQAIEVGLGASADSYVSAQQKNKVFGGRTRLVVEATKSDALVAFDEEAIVAAVGDGTLIQATLELHRIISDEGDDDHDDHDDHDHDGHDHGPPPSTVVSLHRVLASWTEAGATWNCNIDTQPNNHQKDCDPGWSLLGPTPPSW